MMNKNIKNSVPYENFINVTSKEISYVLGFLWADGYLRLPYNVSTKINSKDSIDIKTVFDKTGEWTNYSYKKYDKRTNKNYDTFIITTSNRNLVDFLIENDYDKKSKISPDKILSKIPEEYKSYFFRGYSDGDGCFYNYKNNQQYIIASTYEQDWVFMKNIFKKLNIFYTIKRSKIITKKGKNSNSSQIRITNKNDVDLFGDYIYNNDINFDNIGLLRKYEKYTNIKNIITKRIIYWTDEDLNFLKDNYNKLSNNKIALFLNKTKYSVDVKSSRLKLKNKKS